MNQVIGVAATLKVEVIVLFNEVPQHRQNDCLIVHPAAIILAPDDSSGHVRAGSLSFLNGSVDTAKGCWLEQSP
jgi:hypothetical protein